MDFPVYEKGELVRANFDYAQLEPFSLIGVIVGTLEHPNDFTYYRVLWQENGQIDSVPYSSLEKIPID